MDSPSKHPPFTFCIARWTAYHGPLGPTADPDRGGGKGGSGKGGGGVKVSSHGVKSQKLVPKMLRWVKQCHQPPMTGNGL